MKDWKTDVTDALGDFYKVAGLAGVHLDAAQLRVEFLPAPHKPTELLAGEMAIYGFWGLNQWLKIGMVGSSSRARYVSQHYDAGRAGSTLSGSLVHDQRMAQTESLQTGDVRLVPVCILKGVGIMPMRSGLIVLDSRRPTMIEEGGLLEQN